MSEENFSEPDFLAEATAGIDGQPAEPSDPAAYAFRLFVEVSRDYPAIGDTQAGTIALRALSLETTPNELLAALRQRPDLIERLGSLANEVHARREVKKAPRLDFDYVNVVLGRIFGLAQSMMEQMSPDRIQEWVGLYRPSDSMAYSGERTGVLRANLGLNWIVWP